MFQFEKLLKKNNISENELEERAITKQIEKFRALQKKITPETTFEEKEAIENQLDEIDDSIMKTLPEFFDIEDEAEINKSKAKSEKEANEKAEAEKQAKLKKEKEEKDAIEAELNKPATNDDDALDKLYQKGKKQVTIHDLKLAGFNVGMFGSLGPNGTSTKRYKLIRENVFQPNYDLIKK